MPPESPAQSRARFLSAVSLLAPLDWCPVGFWRFEKSGRIFDLSAADLSRIAEIEKSGAFVVSS